MVEHEPVTEVDPRYSDDGATPTAWGEARRQLEEAPISWLSTVRPEGHPHVTPLLTVWLDGALHFCTGADERKARNLAQNPHCILTTGCSTYDRGLDLVVQGEAVQVRDDDRLRRLAAAWESKYGTD